jgi:hypothetical protein
MIQNDKWNEISARNKIIWLCPKIVNEPIDMYLEELEFWIDGFCGIRFTSCSDVFESDSEAIEFPLLFCEPLRIAHYY